MSRHAVADDLMTACDIARILGLSNPRPGANLRPSIEHLVPFYEDDDASNEAAPSASA